VFGLKGSGGCCKDAIFAERERERARERERGEGVAEAQTRGRRMVREIRTLNKPYGFGC